VYGGNFELNLILKSAILENEGQRARFEWNLSLMSAIIQYGGQCGKFKFKMKV